MKLKLFLTSLIFVLLFCFVPNRSFTEDYPHPEYDFLVAKTKENVIHLCFVKEGKKEIHL